MAEERVRATIDLGAEGLRCGHFHVPISTNDSAYGVVSVPIAVARKGEGPTVLLIAGVHGDEYEGPLVLTRLAQNLDHTLLNGRLIIVPALNFPAFKAGHRNSPLDGLNLNRLFPGNIHGGPSEMIADYVARILFSESDIVVDLHSGGQSLLYQPLAATHRTGDHDRDTRALSALRAFAAPIGLVASDIDSYGLLDYTAESKGKLVITTELGGGGGISPRAVAIGELGVRRILAHFEVLEMDIGTEQEVPKETRLMETQEAESFVMAGIDGIYEPVIELGGDVSRGSLLGRIHGFDLLQTKPLPIESGVDGVLICRRAQGGVSAGDCVGLIARDFEISGG
ncbi:MAG: N-alpha-acetyl diaminobutyric acid deacetylase DoeB [Rhodospirillaceae bacterium]|nr:N-alpha-acetyl diaminobutyric acid deacetylase DoeB [Rhodospirillaceae bacterium]MBT5245146.1 N-alpha-acetyl diaminobutyric acid deacetylase DoeB [Rhodospirillaceae bacterium]MBT7136631.1 N-alpha-acetyl diaminobutyric acid deacetylase DoeB [Rhodospirillaceae bacterium]